ncbi:MAG: hypothetical protein ABIQ73_16780 [Acidimicrobiales bacterium]
MVPVEEHAANPHTLQPGQLMRQCAQQRGLEIIGGRFFGGRRLARPHWRAAGGSSQDRVGIDFVLLFLKPDVAPLRTVILVVSTLTLLAVLGEVFIEWNLYSDLSCADPAASSDSVFGKALWSRWPPGSYCDYRGLHPDWPESAAIRGRPSPIRGVLLLVAAFTSTLSAVYLWTVVKRRRRQRGVGSVGGHDETDYRSALNAVQTNDQTSTAGFGSAPSSSASSSEVETGTS